MSEEMVWITHLSLEEQEEILKEAKDLPTATLTSRIDNMARLQRSYEDRVEYERRVEERLLYCRIRWNRYKPVASID